MNFLDRSAHCKNALAKKLFLLMEKKQTNLALSADVTSAAKLLEFADKIGPEICILKTHIDIIDDFSLELTQQLQALAERHQFLIFEDRKFADIGNTVKLQYERGVYHIADWADIINAHSLPGPGIVSGLAEAGLSKSRGLLLLAEMSSANNLFDASYVQKTMAMAEQFPEFVIGFIAQHKLAERPDWLYMTPGIQFAAKNDALGQQYVTPEQAIIENGTDIIIVGRGILSAADPLKAAQQYRMSAWNAYLQRMAD